MNFRKYLAVAVAAAAVSVFRFLRFLVGFGVAVLDSFSCGDAIELSPGGVTEVGSIGAFCASTSGLDVVFARFAPSSAFLNEASRFLFGCFDGGVFVAGGSSAFFCSAFF